MDVQLQNAIKQGKENVSQNELQTIKDLRNEHEKNTAQLKTELESWKKKAEELERQGAQLLSEQNLKITTLEKAQKAEAGKVAEKIELEYKKQIEQLNLFINQWEEKYRNLQEEYVQFKENVPVPDAEYRKELAKVQWENNKFIKELESANGSLSDMNLKNSKSLKQRNILLLLLPVLIILVFLISRQMFTSNSQKNEGSEILDSIVVENNPSIGIKVGDSIIAIDPSKLKSSAQIKDYTETAGGLSLDMVAINGGTFTMGSTTGNDNEKPTHQVTVSDFYMGKYEVTQAEYKAVMGKNPSNFKGDKLPVEQVSWYDAIEFCNALSLKAGLQPYYTIDKTKKDPNNSNSYDDIKWLVTINKNAKGYRLPTEAEWEYAAGGGGSNNRTDYAGINTETSLSDYAWYSQNSGSKTHAVGTKKQNSLGLYDMSGNVWEWCWDWYGNYSSGSQTNPLGAESGSYRVLRGGSWLNNSVYCRVAYRSNDNPGNRDNDFGFRVACAPSL
jgi:formylglycine-generating enzyme required for sulfatase activity